MFGVLVNALAVIAGSGLGLLLRRGLPQKYTDRLMQALGLCVIVIGILGLNAKVDSMAVILSIVLGSVPIRRACGSYITLPAIQLLPQVGGNGPLFGALDEESEAELSLHPYQTLKKAMCPAARQEAR